MKFLKIVITVILFFTHCILFSQSFSKKSIEFVPVMGTENLIPGDSKYKLVDGDSVQIESLRFYISGVVFLEHKKVVWKEKNSYHLVDASVNKSLKLVLNTIPNQSFDQIQFNLGIDSLTNVSGAMGGDLDPTKGMYWTWQSGYINFKLEGKSKKCQTHNNEFQFHLGGYQAPFKNLQVVVLNVNSKENNIIKLNVEEFMNGIDLSKQNQIMSPGKEAVEFSLKASKIFSVEKK